MYIKHFKNPKDDGEILDDVKLHEGEDVRR